MTRRAPTSTLAILVLLGALAPSAVAAADPVPLPASMAAVGDSITQAASTGGSLGADAPQNSWATGTNSTVNSHYLRLLELGAPIGGANHNRSVSGAKMAGLAAQMAEAGALAPDYLTVLIGGNDLCTDTVAQMTAVTDFRAQFESAMATLTTASPATSVYVVSIPDVYQLWSLFKNNYFARFVWSSADICQSLLANPTSTQSADVQRRAAVRQRNIDYNIQLGEVCAAYLRCRFDGNAVFNTPLTKSDVSGDYFHPSISGQAKLASVSFAAGYTWGASSPPANEPPAASLVTACSGLICSFEDTSVDADGEIDGRAWTFGDGGTSIEATPTHTYEVAGTYEISLTVTDDDGATATAYSSVTVDVSDGPRTMVIAALSSTAAVTGKNTWTATATASVTDPEGAGVAGATVTASWSVGAGDTCLTDSAGRCSVTSDSLNRKRVASVTLTVTGVSHVDFVYDPSRSVTQTSVNRPS